MRLLTWTLVSLTCSVAGAAASAPPGFEQSNPFQQQVEGPKGWFLEGGLVIKDLHALRATFERSRQDLRQTRVGRAYYAEDAAAASAPAFDELHEIDRLLAVADPGNTIPVPFAIVVLSREDDVQLQLMLGVAPDAAQRLVAEGAKGGSASWGAALDGEQLVVTLGEQKLPARVDGKWLRIATQAEALTPSLPLPQLSGTLAAEGQEADSFVYLDGNGMILRQLRSNAGGGPADAILGSTQALALTYKSDGDKSWRIRLLMDAVALKQLGPMFRRAQLGDPITKLLGADTTGLATLALPQAVLQAAVGTFTAQLATDGYPPLPAEINEALVRMDGRIGLASFGAPGDWAMALTFANATDAAAVAPALVAWAGQISPKVSEVITKLIADAPLPTAQQKVLALRAHPALEGWRIVPLGETLFIVHDRARAERLAARFAALSEPVATAATAPPASGDPKSPEAKAAAERAALAAEAVAGPLTPMVRATIEKPAMLSAYYLSTSDATWAEWAAWLGTAIEIGLATAEAEKEQPESLKPHLQSFISRLPLLFGLLGVQGALLYDMALGADINDSVFVIEATSSGV